MVNKKYLIYETRKCVHNFQQFKTTRCYAKNIFAVDITLIDADKDQRNSPIEIVQSNKNTKPKKYIERKKQKKDTHENIKKLYEGIEMVFNTFKREIFSLQPNEGTGIKILTPRQAPQR